MEVIPGAHKISIGKETLPWEKHVARLCPESKICKIPNCSGKHPTVLHKSNVREKSSVDVGIGTGDSTDTPVLNAMANAGVCPSSLDLGKRVPGHQWPLFL